MCNCIGIGAESSLVGFPSLAWLQPGNAPAKRYHGMTWFERQAVETRESRMLKKMVLYSTAWRGRDQLDLLYIVQVEVAVWWTMDVETRYCLDVDVDNP